MTLFLLRRLGLLVVAFFVTSVVVFLLLRLLPGDLAVVVGGTDAPPERIEALRESLGLNRPLVAQYGDWIGGILTGDFGTSALNGASVTDELEQKLEVSAPLVFASTAAVDPGRGTTRHHRRRPPSQARRPRVVGGQPTRHRASNVLGRPDARDPVRRPLAHPPGPGIPVGRVERDRSCGPVARAADDHARAVAGRRADAVRALGHPRRVAPGVHPHGAGEGSRRGRRPCSATGCATRRCRSCRSSACRSPA